ncbi:LexA family protein [Pseudomonas lundensis]|uniref:Protein UmuD n=1 Tax=Pseudomonas lundensis TaxID=86185 RepID=A0AAX2HBP4_9PSED|nr:S24 family peptidase [Pseudomonas lundensis]SOB53858.1 Protein UmuD [Pseudomonas lundensis]
MSFTSLGPISEDGIPLPLCTFKVPAGFPSPAADHIEKEISMDQLLNIRAPHVYLVTIDGDSMQGAGIFPGDLAVVDRGVEPVHGHVVVALLNNEPICKRLCLRGKSVILQSENPRYPDLHVMEGDDLSIWGVITYTVRSHVH